MAKKRAPEVLLPGRNVRKQSREAFAAEVAKYQADHQNPNHTMLTLGELEGNYLLERGLETTLGGEKRLITLEDLHTFRSNVEALKQQAAKAKMLGGITAKQVINKSWSIDRERAQDQIYMANPTHYEALAENGGQGTVLMVHFMTNAGPDSDFTHHNVNVSFLDFGAAVASPVPAEKMAAVLLKGRLKFECNCGRFKYWFRYVNTQLGIVAGRTETVFPKIRNPGVSGISCKHGLRVMQTIHASPTMKRYMAKVIQKFRDEITHTQQTERIEDQRAFEESRGAESWNQRTIRSSEEKRTQRQAQPSYQKRRAEAQLKRDAQERAKAKGGRQFSNEAEFIAMYMSRIPDGTEEEARLAWSARVKANKETPHAP